LKIRDHRDLTVYQNAFEAAHEVFLLTRHFPPEERFSMTDQARRASRSVGANIAEAWRKRRYPLSFISKLSDADAEAAETTHWLDTALKCGYVKTERHQQLSETYNHICAQLVTMMDTPDQWCSDHTKKGAGQ
jgi:four helix bundle protein